MTLWQKLGGLSVGVVAARLLANRAGAGSNTAGETPDAVNVAKIATIVIIARNEAGQIARSLTHLRAVYPDVTVVLVDDASTDQTFTICKDMERTDPHLFAVHSSGRGKMEALRDAIPLVETRFVLTLDADTLPDSGSVEALAAHLDGEELSACSGHMRPISNGSLLATMQSAEFTLLNEDRRFLSTWGAVSILPGAFTMWARATLASLVEEAQNDIDLTFTALATGHRTGYCPQAGCRTAVPMRFGAVFRQRRRWARRKFFRVGIIARAAAGSGFEPHARLAAVHLGVVHILIALVGPFADLAGLTAIARALYCRRQHDIVLGALYFWILALGAQRSDLDRPVGKSRHLAILDGPWERWTRGLAAWSVAFSSKENDVRWEPDRDAVQPNALAGIVKLGIETSR